MFRYIDKNILCYYNSLYIRLGIYLGIYVLCHENNYKYNINYYFLRQFSVMFSIWSKVRLKLNDVTCETVVLFMFCTFIFYC